jgi:hypothetical protein
MSNHESKSALLIPDADNTIILEFEGTTYYFTQGPTSEIGADLLQLIERMASSIKEDFGGLFQRIISIIKLLCTPEWIHVDRIFDILENIINEICYKSMPSLRQELAISLEIFQSMTNETHGKHQVYLRRVSKEPGQRRRYEKIQHVPLLSSLFKKLHTYSEAKTSALYQKLVKSNDITMVRKANLMEKELTLLHLNSLMAAMVAIKNKGLDAFHLEME